jgi:hypothetical protein
MPLDNDKKIIYTPVVSFEQPIYKCELRSGTELRDQFDSVRPPDLPWPDGYYYLVDLSTPPITLKTYSPSLGKPGSSLDNLACLAKLGYEFQISSNISQRIKVLTDWVKENGLPVYSATLPFRDFPDQTAIEGAAPMVSTLQYAWNFSKGFQEAYPSYFVMPAVALNTLALEACILYLELSRRIEKQKLSPLISTSNPLKEFFTYGQKTLVKGSMPFSLDDIEPPGTLEELQSIYRAFFPERIWREFNNNLKQKGIMLEFQRDDEFLTKLIVPIFEAAVRSYLHHVTFHVDFAAHKLQPSFEPTINIKMRNWLGLAWFELYSLLTYTEISNLEICRNRSCRSIFHTTRSDKKFCSDACGDAYREAERRKRKKEAEKE